MHHFISVFGTAFQTLARIGFKFGKALFAFFKTLLSRFFKLLVFLTRTLGMMAQTLAGLFFKMAQTLFSHSQFFFQFGSGFAALFRTGFNTIAVQLFHIIHHFSDVFQQSLATCFKIVFFHAFLLDIG